MTASIFADPGESDYLVRWLEADGYTRERHFGTFRAAEKFATEVETRLQAEAVAENTARSESGE